MNLMQEPPHEPREPADFVSAWPSVGWITPDDIAIEAGFMKPGTVSPEYATDDDLPGMWSKSDFEGGDPDERSHAEREGRTIEGQRQTIAFTDEAQRWILPDLAPIQEAINRDIAKLVALQAAESGGLARSWVSDYDAEHGTGWRQRVICGIDPASDIDFDAFNLGVVWEIPQSMTLEVRRISIETMELFFGQGLIPLCERRIPAEGTE